MWFASSFFYFGMEWHLFSSLFMVSQKSNKNFSTLDPFLETDPRSMTLTFFGGPCSFTCLWCGAFCSSDEKRIFRRCQDLLCNLRDLNLMQRVFDEFSMNSDGEHLPTYNCCWTIIQCWYYKPFREFLYFFWLLLWLTFAVRGYERSLTPRDDKQCNPFKRLKPFDPHLILSYSYFSSFSPLDPWWQNLSKWSPRGHCRLH